MMATVYTPNSHQDTFFCNTLSSLMDFAEGKLTLGGDLNIPLDPNVDTSTGTSTILPGIHRCILQAPHRHQLIVTWLLFHPGEWDYTFFSTPHHSYS